MRIWDPGRGEPPRRAWHRYLPFLCCRLSPTSPEAALCSSEAKVPADPPRAPVGERGPGSRGKATHGEPQLCAELGIRHLDPAIFLNLIKQSPCLGIAELLRSPQGLGRCAFRCGPPGFNPNQPQRRPNGGRESPGDSGEKPVRLADAPPHLLEASKVGFLEGERNFQSSPQRKGAHSPVSASLHVPFAFRHPQISLPHPLQQHQAMRIYANTSYSFCKDSHMAGSWDSPVPFYRI